MLNALLLSTIEETGVAVLTLTEGLEQNEFLRSRITRAETLRQLRVMGVSLANVPLPTQSLLPEIDWLGWHAVARQINERGAAQDEVLWFTVRSLVPATLSWLRFYRQNQPQVFDWTVADAGWPAF